MELYYVSISMAVGANIIYHVSMKAMNPNINPLFSLAIAYIVAALSTVVLLFSMTPTKILDQTQHLNWTPFALGGAIVILELGFILAYRAGWNLGNAALVCNVAVGVLLIPISIVFFKENLTPIKILGIGFALVGLYLMGKK